MPWPQQVGPGLALQPPAGSLTRMALQENLTQHEAYAAMCAVTDDQDLRDELLARSAGLAGEWTWTRLPDGAGLGLLCTPAGPGFEWSVNHVLP